ncbi:hypothetical protein [Streptomyces sp. NPDC057257]|uniref:hypothetical protein n=1 Tax=Streptomyces sp. NPDC057257 TaxID=3346071 RepID=UPI00362FCEFC
MTKDEGTDTVWGGTEYAEATAEVRRALGERLRGRPVPPDLVVTSRSEIEKRELRAYGQGWRDRGEHEERRRAEGGPGPGSGDGAKVLPFPQQHPSNPPEARPHPADEPS